MPVNILRLFTVSLFFVTAACSAGKSADPQAAASPGAPAPQTNPDVLTASGGDWQSSGGTGVACFAKLEYAEQFDSDVAQRIALSDERVAQIETLVTLEKWEDQISDVPMYVPLGVASDQILNRLHARLRKHAALFSYKLKEVEKRISFNCWKSEYLLEPTKDADPIIPAQSELTPNCRLIQLAIRYSKPSAVTEMPEVFVTFDSRLYGKLNSEDRAILKLHENLYLFGRLVGHENAYLTRELVKKLLSEEFWSYEDDPGIPGQRPSSLQSMLAQNAINQAFGDYVHLIFKESPAIIAPEPFSNESRYNSLRSLILKMRTASDECHAKTKHPNSETKFDCLRAALTSVEVAHSLTEEEAFLMYHRWFITYHGDGIPDSETSVVPWTSEEDIQTAREGMEMACRHTLEFGGQVFLQDSPHILEATVKKAQRYCGKYVNSLNPPPMETNQN